MYNRIFSLYILNIIIIIAFTGKFANAIESGTHVHNDANDREEKTQTFTDAVVSESCSEGTNCDSSTLDPNNEANMETTTVFLTTKELNQETADEGGSIEKIDSKRENSNATQDRNDANDKEEKTQTNTTGKFMTVNSDETEECNHENKCEEKTQTITNAVESEACMKGTNCVGSTLDPNSEASSDTNMETTTVFLTTKELYQESADEGGSIEKIDSKIENQNATQDHNDANDKEETTQTNTTEKLMTINRDETEECNHENKCENAKAETQTEQTTTYVNEINNEIEIPNDSSEMCNHENPCNENEIESTTFKQSTTLKTLPNADILGLFDFDAEINEYKCDENEFLCRQTCCKSQHQLCNKLGQCVQKPTLAYTLIGFVCLLLAMGFIIFKIRKFKRTGIF